MAELKIELKIREIISYIVLLVFAVLLLNHYFCSPTPPPELNDERDTVLVVVKDTVYQKISIPSTVYKEDTVKIKDTVFIKEYREYTYDTTDLYLKIRASDLESFSYMIKTKPTLKKYDHYLSLTTSLDHNYTLQIGYKHVLTGLVFSPDGIDVQVGFYITF